MSTAKAACYFRIYQKLCHFKTQQKCTDTFCAVSEEHKKLYTIEKQFCFSVDTNRCIDIVSIYCTGQHAATYCLI